MSISVRAFHESCVLDVGGMSSRRGYVESKGGFEPKRDNESKRDVE
jgi:hypothetical protein